MVLADLPDRAKAPVAGNPVTAPGRRGPLAAVPFPADTAPTREHCLVARHDTIPTNVME
jgi:hypothetical protein